MQVNLEMFNIATVIVTIAFHGFTATKAEAIKKRL